MKKFVVAVIFVALMMFSSQAYAATVKKVINVSDLNAGLTVEELQKKLKNTDKVIKSRENSIKLWNLQIEKDDLAEEVKQGKFTRIENEQEMIDNLKLIRESVVQAIAELQNP